MDAPPIADSRRRVLFWLVVVVLLSLVAALEFTSVRQESQTSDEGRQLISGYSYLVSGHFTIAREHPPLLKLLWAIPVWFLHPDLPNLNQDTWLAAVDFLYKNRVPADSMLMAGRSSAIAISLLLGWTIALWTRRHFGIPASLFALFLYALDPNFLAHGRYMKNDVGAALAIFGVVMVWGSYLARPTRKRLWLCGLVLGLALVTKTSTLILWPVMLILWCVHRWQERRSLLGRDCLRVFATMLLIVSGVIFLAFGCEFEPAGREAFRNVPSLSWLATIPLPAVGYLHGLGNIARKQVGALQEVSYLMGAQSASGWRYLPLIALAVKTPLAEIALFGMALALATRRLRNSAWRDISFRWYLLLVPAAIYFVASLLSHSTAGERHMLPLLPFLYVLTAALLCAGTIPLRRRLAMTVAGLVLIAETASIHPHYLAFFNALAGGPIGGREFLVDSNLDWGQDLKNLKLYFDQHGINQAYVYYYGWADLGYYGVPNRMLPDVPTLRAAESLNAVAAVSATYLSIFHARFAGLDAIQPDARIGYSIYVYDLRKHPEQ